MLVLQNPIWNRTPDESTVEQLSNHQILMTLGPHSTWMYVPSRTDEEHLGYDAALQDRKFFLIQYKKLNTRQHVRSFAIDTDQHGTL